MKITVQLYTDDNGTKYASLPDLITVLDDLNNRANPDQKRIISVLRKGYVDLAIKPAQDLTPQDDTPSIWERIAKIF